MLLDSLYMGLLLCPFAFFFCCCNQADPCEHCDSTPATINVQFTGFTNGSCGTCTDYNTTVFSATQVAPCTWEVAGSCSGDLIRVLMNPAEVKVLVISPSLITLSDYRLTVADPWDCQSNVSVPLFSDNVLHCDASASTCQIN